MKKSLKKFVAFAMVFAMSITTVNVHKVQSEAAMENIDLDEVTTKCNIVNNGNNNLLSSLGNSEYTIEGVMYNNYAVYDGVTATASSRLGGNVASKAIDKDKSTRWESVHHVDPQYLEIDLGNLYAVKAIGIFWEGASAKNYKIEISTDGNTYQNLTEVTSNYGKRTDEIILSKTIKVRKIRIYCVSRTTDYGDSIYEIGIYGPEEQKEVVEILSDLVVKDYYNYTGRYMIYFKEPDDVEEYNVYIDNNATPIKTLEGSGEYVDEEDLEGVSKGQHQLSVAAVSESGEETSRLGTTITIGDNAGTYNDIAQVYIYTKVGISTEYHENKDVTVTVIDEKGKIDTLDSESNVKIRGNTTAAAPKKPWNIKLGKKSSILGMAKCKKWCILANSFDKSLMRNRLSYQLGLENGLDYNCENRYVDVYINGVFNGNYLITEAVGAGKGRVEIEAYDEDNLDILLELGTRNEAGVDHFRTSMQVFDVNEPEKGDDLTDEQVDAKIARVQTYLNSFESTLLGDDYDEILKYIDEDSFVDFYIANELFKNVDFNFSSTRFHINDDKIYAGPMWDFDLSSGNCKSSYYTNYYVDGVSWKGYYCQGMVWYKELFKKDEFYSKVKLRYEELQYVIQNIYKNGSTQSNSIDSLIKTYGASFQRNYLAIDKLGAGWELTNDDGYSYAAQSGWTTWIQPIEFLRDWLKNRNEWLCSQWGIDMSKAYEESKPGTEETTTQAPTTQEPTTQAPTTEAPTTEAATPQAPTTEPETTEPVVTTTEPKTTEAATTEPVVTTTEPKTTEAATTEPVVTTTEPKTTTAETTEPVVTTTEKSGETTVVSNETTNEPKETPTATSGVTTVVPTTKKQNPTTAALKDNINTKVETPAKAKINKVYAKKKSAKNVKISLKKINSAVGYQVAIYKTKNSAKKNKKALVKKIVMTRKFTIKSKKLKDQEKLFVRARAFVLDSKGKKIYGKWSNIKIVSTKK